MNTGIKVRVTCAHCEGLLEPEAEGRSDALSSAMTARCTECGRSWLLRLTMSAISCQPRRGGPAPAWDRVVEMVPPTKARTF